MATLVSLDLVKQVLRVDTDDDDAILDVHIETVTEAVLRFLRRRSDDDEWNEATVPRAVRGAILLGVGSLYDEDAAELISGLSNADPKNPLVALLCMQRRPTYA